MEAEQWCLVRQEELDMLRRKDILGNSLLCVAEMYKSIETFIAMSILAKFAARFQHQRFDILC